MSIKINNSKSTKNFSEKSMSERFPIRKGISSSLRERLGDWANNAQHINKKERDRRQFGIERRDPSSKNVHSGFKGYDSGDSLEMDQGDDLRGELDGQHAANMVIQVSQSPQKNENNRFEEESNSDEEMEDDRRQESHIASVVAKIKTEKSKVGKSKKTVVEPIIDLENSEESPAASSEETDLAAEVADYKDKYLRLYSEFENYRRRTSKERLELISTANSGLMEALIPIADDFDRALKAGTEGAVEGVELIFNKFKNTLESRGLKKMGTIIGDDFDEDFHEAITQIPPPDEDLAGKIVDVVEPGYFLGEKVIRFAKVVTGSKK
jgi:molecular chaperone GrpE